MRQAAREKDGANMPLRRYEGVGMARVRQAEYSDAVQGKARQAGFTRLRQRGGSGPRQGHERVVRKVEQQHAARNGTSREDLHGLRALE